MRFQAVASGARITIQDRQVCVLSRAHEEPTRTPDRFVLTAREVHLLVALIERDPGEFVEALRQAATTMRGASWERVGSPMDGV